MSVLSNCYKVLGISRGSSLSEIKTQYKKLAMVWHPDKNGGDLHLSTKFRDATEAYDILIDPTRRQQHDRDLDINEGRSSTYSSYQGHDGGGFSSSSGTWDYGGVYGSQAGYDHPHSRNFKGWGGPPPPPDHPLFDHETWKAMHYGDARTSTAGALEPGAQPTGTGVFANVKSGLAPERGQSYQGMGAGMGGVRETTVQDVKVNIVNRMDERRNERLKKEAEKASLTPEQRRRMENEKKGACVVS